MTHADSLVLGLYIYRAIIAHAALPCGIVCSNCLYVMIIMKKPTCLQSNLKVTGSSDHDKVHGIPCTWSCLKAVIRLPIIIVYTMTGQSGPSLYIPSYISYISETLRLKTIA